MSSAARWRGAWPTSRTMLLSGVFLVPAVYLSTCSYVSHKNGTAFDGIAVGDPEMTVVQLLGAPSVREKMGESSFGRYSTKPCNAPCAERLWFENRLSLDTQAWSVDLDINRRVIDKHRWMSP